MPSLLLKLQEQKKIFISRNHLHLQWQKEGFSAISLKVRVLFSRQVLSADHQIPSTGAQQNLSGMAVSVKSIQ
jgi:hypothetical protein